MTMLRFHRSGATHVARLLPLTALALGLAWTSPAEAQDQPTRAPAPVVRKAPAKKKASKAPAAKTKAPEAAPPVDAEDEAAEAPAEADEPAAAEAEADEVAADEDQSAQAPEAEAEKAPRVVIVHKEVPAQDEPAEAERETAPSEQTSKTKKKKNETKASSRAKHSTAVVPAFVLSSSPKPDELEYTEGGEIPPGYEMDTRMRKGLVIGGAVTLGAAWLLSSAAATMLIQKREEDTMGGSFEYRVNHDEGDPPPEAPLYIPLAGPWIALRTMHDLGPEGKAALVADGVVQAAGLAMLIGGLAARQKVLVRTEQATVGVAAGVGSAYMTGSF